MTTTCQLDLAELNIKESLDEINLMTKEKFKQILKQRIKENALAYLIGKQGSKGRDIRYEEIKMQEYLLPWNKLTICDKRNLFSVRNRMIQSSSNFPMNQKEVKCVCGSKEDMEHIYSCNFLNKIEETLPYQKIYEGNISQQIEVFKRFDKKF